jgi:hypothetical protein
VAAESDLNGLQDNGESGAIVPVNRNHAASEPTTNAPMNSEGYSGELGRELETLRGEPAGTVPRN